MVKSKEIFGMTSRFVVRLPHQGCYLASRLAEGCMGQRIERKTIRVKTSSSNQQRTIHGLDLDIFGQNLYRNPYLLTIPPKKISDPSFNHQQVPFETGLQPGGMDNIAPGGGGGSFLSGSGTLRSILLEKNIPSGKVTVCKLENHHL